MHVMVCLCVSTEGLTRWVCFPSVLVNRSRAAFMCWAHYHGDGRDGNAVAAQVWQATVCLHRPHVSTSSSSPPQYMVFILTARAHSFTFSSDAELNHCGSGSGLTCPHSSSPTPMNTHHSHWSMVRAVQENGFPPNWTMMIWGGKEMHGMCQLSEATKLLENLHRNV